MGFLEAVETCVRKYVRGGGRACRSEYWYWALFYLIVGVVGFAIDLVAFPTIIWGPSEVMLDMGPAEAILDVLLFLPSWAVAIRRLHDINRTGYWVLIGFTIVGILLVVYWACVKGTDGDNDYGADPLQANAG